MCVTLRNKWLLSDCWLPEDNHVIAGLVSILLTRVLGDDRFHLLRCIKRPKVKAYVWNLGVNKKRPFEISSDDLINEACSKLTRKRHCISLSQSFKIVALIAMWAFSLRAFRLLDLCIVFEIFICGYYNKQQTDWLQPGRVSMLQPFVMHTMTTIIRCCLCKRYVMSHLLRV